jgi:poly(3-hydroxybutyrate) depolymerase
MCFLDFARAPRLLACAASLLAATGCAHTAAATPAEWPGIERTLENADVAAPSGLFGPTAFFGKWRSLPTAGAVKPVPVVVFLHGSSGQSEATRAFQKWLAESLGVASVAPDSMSLPNRITYQSPVSKEIYERVHALRAAEIQVALEAVKRSSWADPTRLLLAGTSEGSVAVARWPGADFAGRMIYAWSCEKNYFVDEPRTAVRLEEPVLNVISGNDPYFSAKNPWNAGYDVRGHCGEAFKAHKTAMIVLLPHLPHTLFNDPLAQGATAGFVRAALRLR